MRHRHVARIIGAILLAAATCMPGLCLDKGAAIRLPDGTTQPGTKWALVIGINNYGPDVGALRVAVADAKRFARCLVEDAGYSPEHVMLLTDEGWEVNGELQADVRPTYTTLRGRIAGFTKEHKGSDTLIIFFSGHGFHSVPLQKDFLAPSDVQPDDLPGTAIRVDDVLDKLRDSGARQGLLIVDACRDRKGKSLAGDDMGEQGLSRAKAQGLWYLASCKRGQISRESDELGGGFYTYYLVKGLKGAADGVTGVPRDGMITVSEAATYAEEQVEAVTRARGPLQTPCHSEFDVSGGEMIISVPGMELGPITIGNRGFKTIFEAMAAAAWGDTIELQAGTYNEHVELKSGVTLKGAGPDKTVIRADALTPGVPGDPRPGALVVDVKKGSPADGVLKLHDAILRVNGAEVESAWAVTQAIEEADPGGLITLDVLRAAQTQRLSLRVAQAPDNEGEGTKGWIGAAVIDRKQRAALGAESVQRGSVADLTVRASEDISAAAFSRSDVSLSNVIVQGGRIGLLCVGGTAKLDRCGGSGAQFAIVELRADARLEATGTTIRDTPGTGLYAMDCSAVELQQCEVASCAWIGITAIGTVQMGLHTCGIHDNTGSGALALDEATLLVEDCEFAANRDDPDRALTGRGVEAGDAAQVTVRRSKCHDNQETGMRFAGTCTAEVLDSEVFRNKCHGITAKGQSRVTSRRGRYYENMGVGILAQEDTVVVSEDDDCYGHRSSAEPVLYGRGIESGGSANVTVRGGKFHDNEEMGIRLGGKGLAEATAVACYRNGWHGLLVVGEGQATVRQTRLHENIGTGLIVTDSATLIAEDNECYGNRTDKDRGRYGNGIAAWGSGRVTLLRNDSHDNTAVGIIIGEKRIVEATENEVRGNADQGLQISGQAEVTATRNRCIGNIGAGILAYDSIVLVAEGNECHENRDSEPDQRYGRGIELAGKARATLTANKCSRNVGDGIVAFGEAAITVTGNECQGNGLDGIRFWEKVTGSAANNVCTGNKRYGISLARGARVALTGNSLRDNGIAGTWREP